MVYLGSFASEGGHGLAWVDLDGRKQGGVGWVGGAWTGSPFLARDDGPRRDANAALYVAAPWSVETFVNRAKDKRGEVRLTAVTPRGEQGDPVEPEGQPGTWFVLPHFQLACGPRQARMAQRLGIAQGVRGFLDRCRPAQPAETPGAERNSPPATTR